MSRRVFHLFCFAVCLAVPFFALAQEGHPLTGTWSGDWGPTAAQRNHLTIVMNWDGKNVTGLINPGPDAILLGSVFLHVTNWTIRIDSKRNDKRRLNNEHFRKNVHCALFNVHLSFGGSLTSSLLP